jgi:hypothetical protein
MKTWGELRTLNADKLIEEMVKMGKGVRVIFRMSVNPESTEWVIIPKADYDQILFDHAKINNLTMRLKTIVNVAEL